MNFTFMNFATKNLPYPEYPECAQLFNELLSILLMFSNTNFRSEKKKKKKYIKLKHEF